MPEAELEFSLAARLASEEKYHALFESIDEGFCIVEVLFDAEGQRAIGYRFLEMNPAFVRQTGLAGVVGRTISEVAPGDEDFWFETYGRIAETGEAQRFTHASEALVPPRFYDVYAFRTGAPEQRRVAVLLHDITEAKQAAEALCASEVRLRTLAENLPGGAAFIVDRDLRYQLAEGEALKLTGLAPGELVGRTVADVVGPELAALFEPNYRRALAGEPFTHEHESHGRSFLTRGVPLRDATGEVEGVLAVSFDLTERKRTEAELRASDERLRLINESLHEYAIVSMDFERRVTSWNLGAEQLLGFAETEISGQPADVIFTEEDRARGLPALEAATALEKGRARDERWHQRKDGTRFWGSGLMMPLRNPAGEPIGLVKIFRDYSEVREAQLALKESHEQLWAALQEKESARAEAEAASQAKDRLFAVLSHELRTPLTPILLATGVLARRKDLPEPVQEAVAMIRRNVQLEASLVDDLLDVTRIARGKLELTRVPMDFHEAIRRAIEVCDHDLQEKEQRLVVRLEAGLHCMHGDFARLQQVVWNLLKNASKFTPPGGEVRLGTADYEGEIVLEVSDTGIGISAETLPHLFEAFQQADATIARDFGGLGLGLAIAKATVLGHEGQITVASEGLGRGAAFTVRLPISKPAQNAN